MLSKRVSYKLVVSLFGFSSLMVSHSSMADSPAPTFGDIKHKPTLDQLYRSSGITHKYVDFSMFHYVPKGDQVKEEPDKQRLLFRKPGGLPDGYAERKGEVIFYYDASGKLIRIQKLAEDP
ncbi:hypothetical protein PT277_00740 [Acetobacteraceae bacterium ESL0709]|nr:hypothetical protein [Acetobacteraceae bacterium ESL0697]MDF7677240.1 hypothetical protein [Acetobacteraceae bacterium ESL0709]